VVPIAAVFGLGGVCLMAFFPALALQAGLLVAAVIVWRFLQQPPGRFIAWSCTATVLAYAVVGWFALQDTRRLLAQFPYESMVERLPIAIQQPTKPLTQPQLDGLAKVEDLIDGLPGFPHQHRREDALKRLHEDTVQVFASRPGFGVARMRPWEWQLGSRRPSEPSPPQPGSRITFPWSSGELEQPTLEQKTELGDESFGNLHQAGILLFLEASDFGYFKDRRHVAGFRPHQFSAAPKVEQKWSLQTVDLIGLATHSQPMAYVSDNLPRMEELRNNAATRPLDEFEAAGLSRLRNGEELFVRDRAEGSRVLGAIRATKQCVSCHGCERGDLLGAFSYTLTRAK
jgi:hypothetical protein